MKLSSSPLFASSSSAAAAATRYSPKSLVSVRAASASAHFFALGLGLLGVVVAKTEIKGSLLAALLRLLLLLLLLLLQWPWVNKLGGQFQLQSDLTVHSPKVRPEMPRSGGSLGAQS